MPELQEEIVEQVDEQVEETSTNTQASAPEYTEIEQQAMEQGWRPKAEWEGDESKWRDAKEFVERGELYGKIDTMGRDLKETKKALRMLQEHHAKLKDVEYKKAVDELKVAQKKHLESGDSDAYLETTEILTDIKAEQKAREVVRQNTPQQVDPRFTQWVETNKWYSTDKEMKQYADIIGQGYAKAYPETDPEDVLKYVTAEVKSKFKDKFVNPNRTKPSSVESGSGVASTGNKAFEMSDEERKVMNTFIRQGIMTKEAYMEELKSMRGTA